MTGANLTHNLGLIVEGLRAGPDTVVVSWLPQYHDMGLVGAYLGVAYCGGRGCYLSPAAFVRRPVVWLEAMSKHGATHVQVRFAWFASPGSLRLVRFAWFALPG